MRVRALSRNAGVSSEQQADIQRNIRRRLIRALTRRGLLETDAADEMAAWEH